MNTDFLKDAEVYTEDELSFEDSSQENVEIPDQYLKVFDQMKNKQMCFDDEKNVYYYESSEIGKYLKTRNKGRVSYFERLKRKHNLNFTDEANEMFLKFLDFVYFEKISYCYFIKKICDLYNIPNTLKVKNENEKIWNDFLSQLP